MASSGHVKRGAPLHKGYNYNTCFPVILYALCNTRGGNGTDDRAHFFPSGASFHVIRPPDVPTALQLGGLRFSPAANKRMDARVGAEGRETILQCTPNRLHLSVASARHCLMRRVSLSLRFPGCRGGRHRRSPEHHPVTTIVAVVVLAARKQVWGTLVVCVKMIGKDCARLRPLAVFPRNDLPGCMCRPV